MTLGERIRECRQKARLSQEKVAELVGVSRQAVTKWEADQTAPSTENLFKLAEIFGTTVDMLAASDGDGKQSQAEQIYQLYKTVEERKAAERQRKVRKNVCAAALTAVGYLAVYLLGRLIWCDPSGSTVMGWLVYARPSGEHSYLYGWLLSSNLFWIAMAVSVLPALFGKYLFSCTTLAGFVLGLPLGILLGPNPEGAAYGHGDYGWAIWGGIFLLSIPAGIIVEKLKKHKKTKPL